MPSLKAVSDGMLPDRLFRMACYIIAITDSGPAPGVGG
jgi:hypothetical protein